MAVHAVTQLSDAYHRNEQRGECTVGFLTKSPTVMPHCLSNLPAFDEKDRMYFGHAERRNFDL